MKKYIKATIDEGAAIHIDGEWLDALTSANAVDPRIIDSICFDEDAGYFELDNLGQASIDRALAFGMLIQDDMLVIPKNLEFKFNFAASEITRNGIHIFWDTFDGYPVCIKFTSLGYRCYALSEQGDKSFSDIVDSALTFLAYKPYFDGIE